MKTFQLLLILLFFFIANPISPQSSSREVAITIDDLPVASFTKDQNFYQQLTTDLLAKVKKYNILAIGFVVEGKLYHEDRLINERVDILKQWLDAGFDLGNHHF